MQNIVIISAVYPPEPVVSARMSFDLANFLVNSGNQVTVICPQPSRPASANYSQYASSYFPMLIPESGVEVVRLPSYNSPKASLLPRLYESWSFGRHVCQYLAKSRLKPDMMYVNAWPLFAQAHIIRHAQKHDIPVTLQIMDIYPESLVKKMPALLRYFVYRPLLKLDSWIARQSRSIIVISDNMRRTYTDSRGIATDHINTIPTWQDDSLFDLIVDKKDACHRYGIPADRFTFLYLGNIGPVAGVDFLIRAFHEAEVSAGQLVIVGDGSAKADCIELSERLKAKHVHFISDPEAGNVPLLQSMADVCMLPMKSGAGMSSIPSKLPAYMFSSRPVLATVDHGSDTARIIQEAKCGWVGPSEDLGWLVMQMRTIASMAKEELTKLGENGNIFGKALYSKTEGVSRLAYVLTSSV